MTAAETVRKVLTWAAQPEGEPPAGPLSGMRDLISRDRESAEPLGRLALVTAARLGAGARPFGDAGPAGPGALLLAAAVGGRLETRLAQRIAEAAPAWTPASVAAPRAAAYGWAEAVARHGVLAALPDLRRGAAPLDGTRAKPVARPRPVVPASLLDALLRVSPLTAILYRPDLARMREQTVAAEIAAMYDLLGRPAGRAVLSTALAAPTDDEHVLAWRTSLLARLRVEHPQVVLDVYLKARLRHGERWDALLYRAADELSGYGLPGELPLAVARYWAPLAALERDRRSWLTERPFLDGYRRALDLVALHGLTETGPSGV